MGTKATFEWTVDFKCMMLNLYDVYLPKKAHMHGQNLINAHFVLSYGLMHRDMRLKDSFECIRRVYVLWE